MTIDEAREAGFLDALAAGRRLEILDRVSLKWFQVKGNPLACLASLQRDSVRVAALEETDPDHPLNLMAQHEQMIVNQEREEPVPEHLRIKLTEKDAAQFEPLIRQSLNSVARVQRVLRRLDMPDATKLDQAMPDLINVTGGLEACLILFSRYVRLEQPK